MTKESIEELWVRSTAECDADPKLVDLSLVVLLNGWNRSDRQDRVMTKWNEVCRRWCRELKGMSACQIDIEMLRFGDDRPLNELSRVGTRLFIAL